MNSLTITFILSFISGSMDTIGFIALAGLFTAHVTGNLVLAGAIFSESNQQGIISRLVMIPTFMIGVFYSFRFATLLKQKNKNELKYLLLLQFILICLIGFVGYIMQPATTFLISDSNTVILVGGLGVLSMSIQNALMRISLTDLVPTTVMTGNVTQFTIELSQHLKPFINGKLKLADEQEYEKMVSLFISIAGFVIGAGIGAFCVFRVGLLSALIAAALTLFVAFMGYKKK